MKKLGIIVLLVLVLGGASMFLFGNNEKIVGKDIKKDDITEFYCTYSATTNPPEFQRYYFHKENGKYYFTHEKREGDTVFLTEDDITVTGTIELTEEEWNTFYEMLEGAKVTSRKKETPAGGGRGPYNYLYWSKDKGKLQVLTFVPYTKQHEFDDYCIELKNRG